MEGFIENGLSKYKDDSRNFFGRLIREVFWSEPGYKVILKDEVEQKHLPISVMIEKIESFGLDYNQMPEAQQYELGAYVNLMSASTKLLVNPILGLQPK